MIEKKIWFEREFELGMPWWMFPDLVERLRGTPVRLEERLRSIPVELLTRRDGEHWSIQEHVGHLLDVETLWWGRVDDLFAGKETMRPADLKNRKTHEANHNKADLGALLKAFRASREDYVERMDGLDEAGIRLTAHHPRLSKPMSMVDLAFFIAEHDDHHLAVITSLIRKF